MIHVTKVLSYQPLSGPASAASQERLRKIDELAKLYHVDPEAVTVAFGRYLVEVIRERVRWSVQTQTVGHRAMKAIYKPLSESYKKRKVPANRDKFWVNTDFLIRHLRVWKHSGQIYLGYPKHVMHPETKDRKKPVWAALIMMWLEHGTSRTPARPLFTPVVDLISKNIGSYFEHFFRGVMSRNSTFLRFIKQSYV